MSIVVLVRRREHFTVRYQGNPQGVGILAGLLRRRGLKVSGDLSLSLPYPGQQWLIRRDFVESYGTVLEVRGRDNARGSAVAAIFEFETLYPDAASIEID